MMLKRSALRPRVSGGDLLITTDSAPDISTAMKVGPLLTDMLITRCLTPLPGSQQRSMASMTWRDRDMYGRLQLEKL